MKYIVSYRYFLCVTNFSSFKGQDLQHCVTMPHPADSKIPNQKLGPEHGDIPEIKVKIAFNG